MDSDAQEVAEVVAPLDAVFDHAYIHRVTLEKNEIRDKAYDEGWEAHKAAAADGIEIAKREARLEGYKEGFASGFKEGRTVGLNEKEIVAPQEDSPFDYTRHVT